MTTLNCTFTEIVFVTNYISPKTALLLEGIARSVEKARNEYYNVFLNNCTNTLFNIVDNVLAPKIDYALINKDFNIFVKDRFDVILKSYLARNESSIKDPNILKSLKQVLDLYDQYKKNPSQSGNFTLTNEQAKLISSLPPFINAQLLARGLIGKAEADQQTGWALCGDWTK